MTLETFNTFRFGKGMRVRYDENNHLIAGVDFEEGMIAMFENDDNGNPLIIEDSAVLIWAGHDDCEVNV